MRNKVQPQRGRQLKAALLVFVLTPALCWASPPAALAVLGSSTAAGTGASQPALSWVGLLRPWLAQARGLTVVNLAAPGAPTDSAVCATEARPELREAVAHARNIDRALKLGANRMILSFPSNDATYGIPTKRTIAQLLSMRHCAQKVAGTRVAVMSSLPRSGLTAEQTAAIAQVDTAMREAFGGCYIDVRASLSDAAGVNPRSDLSFGDGVHFNDAGHAVIFGIVKKFIEAGSCF